jgi:hypothetical protein
LLLSKSLFSDSLIRMIWLRWVDDCIDGLWHDRNGWYHIPDVMVDTIPLHFIPYAPKAIFVMLTSQPTTSRSAIARYTDGGCFYLRIQFAFHQFHMCFRLKMMNAVPGTGCFIIQICCSSISCVVWLEQQPLSASYSLIQINNGGENTLRDFKNSNHDKSAMINYTSLSSSMPPAKAMHSVKGVHMRLPQAMRWARSI